MKIAIQGIKASFHEMAARKHFKDEQLELVECATFPLLFKTLAEGRAKYAVMAIENALAGSILPNYALLEKYGFKIVGEVFLKIEMCLLALPGTKLEYIKVVQSHPMALLQCQEFLNTLQHVQLVAHDDTADSAREIAEKKLNHVASIASRLAADTYQLEVIKAGIETNPANYTRFLILCQAKDYVQGPFAKKSSIRFETLHRPGSLARILNILDAHNINMSMIQSMPVIGKPYHFAFHVDLEWEDMGDYEAALYGLRKNSIHLTEFGEYQSGEKVPL